MHFFSVLSFQMIEIYLKETIVMNNCSVISLQLFLEKIFFFHFYAFQEAVNILAAAHTTI